MVQTVNLKKAFGINSPSINIINVTKKVFKKILIPGLSVTNPMGAVKKSVIK